MGRQNIGRYAAICRPCVAIRYAAGETNTCQYSVPVKVGLSLSFWASAPKDV